MSKLLKNPHGENSPLAGSVELNFPTSALAAAHPHMTVKTTQKQKNQWKTMKYEFRLYSRVRFKGIVKL